MNKIKASIVGAALLGGMLIPAVASASTPEASRPGGVQSVSQVQNLAGPAGKVYGQCRKGTYSWGGWYSPFVFINAQYSGWSCWW